MTFRRTLTAVAALALGVLPGLSHGIATAADYMVPARGTQARADLMDALRPHVEWALGAPVEFLVWDIRIAGETAFAQVIAQRPGGAPIDVATTPMVLRDHVDPEFIDGTRTEAFYVRSGRQWVVVHHAIGATDVWFADPQFCEIWTNVMPLESVCAR